MRLVGWCLSFARLLTIGIGSFTSACSDEALWPHEPAGPPPPVCDSTRRAPKLDPSPDAERISIGETDQTLRVVSLDATGKGRDFVGSLSLEAGVGQVELGCESVPVAIYGRSGDEGGEWYHGIGVRSDRLYPLIFLCMNGKLDSAYYQSTDGTHLTVESAQGSCSELTVLSNSHVTFPNSTFALPDGFAGYTIDGPSIQLSESGSGSIDIAGVTNQLLVFDATTCSPNCDGPAWHNLFALLWSDPSSTVSFARLDLDAGEEVVTLSWMMSLPELRTPSFPRKFEAQFSAP